MSSGALGAIVIVYVLLILGVVALMMASWAMLFKKAGEGWWKIFIPVYGTYTQYKVADSTGLFWGTIATSICYSVVTNLMSCSATSRSYSYYSYSSYDYSGLATGFLVVTIIYLIIIFIIHIFFNINLARAFCRGGGFACGLIFLPLIFLPILAFSKVGGSSYSSSGLARVPSTTETWKCPHCGAENPKSRGSCSECGTVR